MGLPVLKTTFLKNELTQSLIGPKTDSNMVCKTVKILAGQEVIPNFGSFRNIQRISKMHKGQIFPHLFLFFTSSIASLVKIGFGGCNLEGKTLL